MIVKIGKYIPDGWMYVPDEYTEEFKKWLKKLNIDYCLGNHLELYPQNPSTKHLRIYSP